MRSSIVLAAALSLVSAAAVVEKRSEMDGIRGAITNAKQTVDTLNKNLKANGDHVNADMITTFITGLDSQIDNLAATVSEALDKPTLGISGEIGDFLLGPFAQSVTNGLEVLIGNVVGGGADLVSDSAAKGLSLALGQLYSVGSKAHIKTQTLENLAAVQALVNNLGNSKAAASHGQAQAQASKTASAMI